MKHLYYLPLSLFIIAYSCKKEEINHPPVAIVSYVENAGKIELHGEKSIDPDNDPLVYKWTLDANALSIENADKQTSSFNIPQVSENTTFTATLTVSDGQFNDSAKIKINILANYTVRLWGLGNILKSELSNNKDYEWYEDQMSTGTYASVNCGPTSTTMAIKWYNPGFPKTPEDARNSYRSTGGWWYTSDVTKYLNDNIVTNKTIRLDSINVLKEELTAGNIIILCLDMYYITYNSAGEVRKDKFYTTGNKGWGHFIVIKGYKEVDDQTFYEVYDPNSYGKKYSDNTLKGKNRYYNSRDLDAATNIWWDYGIVVTRGTLKSKGVDISKIPDMPGR